RRKRVSENVILEDLFIASLANHKPWNEQQILKLQELSCDKNFCERFARALAKDKPATWDKNDIQILENWRKLRLKPEIEKLLGPLPGLRSWSPTAAIGLFSLHDPDWFRTRVKRLGLTAGPPYEIKNFIVINETVRIIR